MSNSETQSLIESVEREAEMHPIELDAIRPIETDDGSGITIRVLETDADREEDQVGFQVTKPNTQMGRQVFSERLGSGFRALADHLRDDDGDDDVPESETQATDNDDFVEPEQNDESQTEHSNPEMAHDGSVPTGGDVATREVGSFNITTELDEDSLEELSKELDNTFEEITDELPDDERISSIEDDLDDLDNRLSVLEEKLAMLGSFDGGG